VGKKEVLLFVQEDGGQVHCILDSLCDRAGVKRLGFHAMRHHVLSIINDSGKASVKQIQELTGHKRQATTEIYLYSMGQATRDAVDILDQNLDVFLGCPMIKFHDTPKKASKKGSGDTP
jgi:integrase